MCRRRWLIFFTFYQIHNSSRYLYFCNIFKSYYFFLLSL
nr:MAG TPA: hypothetical protein [Caudoviricetes sp.]